MGFRFRITGCLGLLGYNVKFIEFRGFWLFGRIRLGVEDSTGH